jgi:hypothetical protein
MESQPAVAGGSVKPGVKRRAEPQVDSPKVLFSPRSRAIALKGEGNSPHNGLTSLWAIDLVFRWLQRQKAESSGSIVVYPYPSRTVFSARSKSTSLTAVLLLASSEGRHHTGGWREKMGSFDSSQDSLNFATSKNYRRVNPKTREQGRHHVDMSIIQKAIKTAVRAARLQPRIA